MRTTRLWILTTGLLLTAGTAHALTPMEVVQRALRVQQQVADYTATITVSLHAPNIQVPPRTARVYYKRPDKVRVDSTGLAIVPRDALLMGNLARHLKTNTRAAMVGAGTLRGRPVWCIKLTPLDAGPGAGRMLCWIDTERYLLLRSEVWDAVARAITMSFTYTLVQNRYWMPRQLVCEVSPRLLDGSGEKARVSIAFSDYRVNVGLRDSIFEEDR
ncbi:MAG: outer membrane lipoprotein-sorting protein [Armatimonadetes bacterium]|nr:outer membrane lipoprotein-sorting protein [Armatimonadota bacterium]